MMQSVKKDYRQIDHPSDIGLEFFGKDMKSLFENAGRGMFWLMLGKMDDLSKGLLRKIDLEAVDADDHEELLIFWLERLLYDFDVDNVAYKDIKVQRLYISGGKGYISARAYAVEDISNRVNIGIKAPTYHQLAINKQKKGFSGKVIFDV